MARSLIELFKRTQNTTKPIRKSWRRRARLNLEQLETREVLSTLALDPTGSILTYAAGAGISNNLSVSISGGNFVFNDTAETIDASSIAGATGSGTNTVNVPVGSVTAVTLNLGDGADAIASGGVVLAAQALTINHTGTGLTLGGPLTTTGGAISVTNTGTGDITQATAGVITSGGGNILLSGNNGLTIAANVTAGAGTIELDANQDGAGTQGLSETGGLISTTNTTAQALSITVNTSSGGTGSASIDSMSTGTGGTLTVNSNGGSILYAGSGNLSASLQGTTNGGSAPTRVITATNYNFTATGSGSIGTTGRPIQTTNVGSDSNGGSNFSLNGGSSGVYLTDWGTIDMTLTGASATGSGSLRIVTGNASGHNLYVDGNVSAVSGNIYLAADDNLEVHNANVTIGGAGFSGTVWMQGNRDVSTNGQPVEFTDATESIQTSNTTNQSVALSARTPTTQAVYLDIGGGTSGPGIVQVANITTGNGGRVVLNGSSQLSAAQSGTINMVASSDVINVGATGTVELDAISQATTTANYIGNATTPIKVAGGNVVVNSQFGNVWVTGVSATNFTANFTKLSTQTATGPTLNLATTSGALTINGASANVNGGAVNLNGAGGVVLNATLGNSTTGAIAITGPLSGSGNVTEGTGAVTITQTTASSYGGAISGTQNVTLAGGGNLTLTGTSSYSGTTTINSSTLTVNGSLTGTSSITAPGGGTLAGTGTVTSVSPAGGTVAPGAGATVGILNASGNVSASAPATLALVLNGSTGAGIDYDQLNVSASMDLTNFIPAVYVGSSPTLTQGSTFTVIHTGSGVAGSFLAPTTFSALDNPLYSFTAAIVGNTVVLTLANINPPRLLDVSNTGVVSYTTGDGINSNLTVSPSGSAYTFTDTSGPITLSSAAMTAGWTGSGTSTVTGPTSGVTGMTLNLADGTDTLTSVDAGSAPLTIADTGTLTLAGPVTSAGKVEVTGSSALQLNGTGSLTSMAGNITLDPDGSLTIGNGLTFTSASTGTVTLSGVNGSSITLGTDTISTSAVTISTAATLNLNGVLNAGGATITVSNVNDVTAGSGENLIAATLNLTSTHSLGTSANNLNTSAGTIVASSGAGGVYLSQTGSATVTATATGAGNVSIIDPNAADTLTFTGTTSTVSGNIVLSAAGAIALNGNLNAGSGTIAISADTAGSGTAGFTQAGSNSVSTITTTNSGANAVSITVNTAGGGTGNASIRTIAATSGTLNINTYGGSILYAGIDTLDVQQSATSTLAPGITGPVASGTGQGGSGAAPTAGTVNALRYVFTTTGSGSVGTAARPINTSTPASNTELLNAGSGGIYFVDFGNPMTLNGATATGAGNVEVVAANASGHNLTVAGNVTTGSGNIVLAADDNFTINSGVTIGGTGFSGDVYLAANRDTGNTDTLTINGTVSTSNTSASAVVIEGFHAAGNGTNAGAVTVNNITVGNGGTITVSGVPASLATGQSSIIALNSSSVLNAGPLGTVDFIATTMAGNATYSSAVGTATAPITVTAGNVIVTANVGTSGTLTPAADSVYVTDTIAGNFSATTGSTSPSGSINLTDTGGILTIAGATSTGNTGAINLTSTGTGGGITINGPLGSATTGAITINAGTNNVLFTGDEENFFSNDPVTITAGAAVDMANGSNVILNGGSLTTTSGTLVDNGGLLGGAGSIDMTTGFPVTVNNGGTLSPSPSTTGLNINTLTLGQTAGSGAAIYQANLTGSSAGQYGVANVNGDVNLTNANLVVSIPSAANLQVGDTFGIINASGSVNGTFANMIYHTIPGYQFSVNYGSNTVVITVTAVPTVDAVDVTNGTVSFFSPGGIANNVKVAISGGNYVITDSAVTIALTANAVAAGWTGNGTNTVTGPTTGITSLALATSDSNDTITGVAGGAANISISGGGNLDIEGDITTTGTITVSGYGDLTDGAAATPTPGTLTGTTISLSATDGLGTASNPVLTAGTTLTANAASSAGGGVYLSQTGSASVTATALGAGNIDITDPNAADTLTISGPTSTVTGNMTLSSAGAIVVNANISSTGPTGTGGTITINAGTGGTLAAGTAAYSQQGTGTTIAQLITTNTSANAVTITVNTPTGGAGDAIIGEGSVGSNAGGTITVNSNGGNILWSNFAGYNAFSTSQTGTANGGSNAQVLKANNYVFTTAQTGTQSIGTDPRPIQTDSFAAADSTAGAANLTLTAGSGGIYLTDWGANGNNDITLKQAIATGAGNIRVVAANAGGHDLFVDGPVDTGSGSITLDADDDLTFTNNAVLGDATNFSGTVTLEMDRDQANGEFFFMAPMSSITTSNNSSTAVVILGDSASGSNDTVVTTDVAGGGLELANIKVGAGGTIVVNAANGTGTAHEGSIVQQPNTLLDTGGTGTVILNARAGDASGSSNGSALYGQGNIGFGGTPTAPTSLPILTNAATIIATTTATTLANTGSIAIVNSGSANFTATTSGNTSATVSLTSTNGVLTLGGTASTAAGATTVNGAISLTGAGTAGGITVSAPLGSTTTSAITLNAGTNNVLFTSPQTFNQPVTITAANAAAGVELQSGANVTLNGNTVVFPTGTTSTGTQIDAGASLSGSGTIGSNITVLGPAGATPGGTLAVAPSATGLNTNSLALNAGSNFQVTLNGLTSGLSDSVDNVTGTVNLTGSNLVINVGAAAVLHVGDQITIINNDGTDPVTGTFANATFTAANTPGYAFTVSYTGGTSNDVVVTVTQVPTDDTFDVSNGTGLLGAAPGTDNNVTVSIASGNYIVTDDVLINLTANAVAAGWTGSGTNSVTGPTAGITNLTLATSAGNDAITALAAGTANVVITGSGTLTINGPVTSSGSVAISGYKSVDLEGGITTPGAITISGGTDITDGAAATPTPGTLTGSTISLTATDGIGTAGSPVLTAGTTITASAGAGGVALTQTGAASVTATATGAGNIILTDTSGTLTIAGATSTATGNINLSSADALVLGANVSAGTGIITISADTDGLAAAGTQSYNQASASLTASAATITVNTASAGAGDAIIGLGTISGGVTVNSNGGNILWSSALGGTFNTSLTGLFNGGSNGQTLTAAAYSFTATGNGGIGTSARPIQTAITVSNGPVSMSAGNGGAYLVDWGSPVTLTGATATGAGNILVVAANDSGHNLTVTGPVTTGTGNIFIAADDNLVVSAALTTGGTGTSGTVYLGANRDQGNTGNLNLSPGSGSITTANATANAVLLEDYGGVSGTVAGTLTLGTITVGNGGTITATTVPTLGTYGPAAPTSQGQINGGSAAVVLNAGPNGTVVLTAQATTGTTDSYGIGTAALPVVVSAGTVKITNTSSIDAATDSVYVTDLIAGNFSAKVLGTQAGTINLSDTGGSLTINGATSTAGGGAINLGSSGTGSGVRIASGVTLGSATTGAININAPLSGSGTIQMGTGDVTITQNSNSTFAGAFTGAGSTNVVLAGTGVLTVTGASTTGGAVMVNSGGLLVNGPGTLTPAGGLATNGAGLLGGNGTVSGPVNINGFLAPSDGSGGTTTLNTGALTFGASGAYQVDLNHPVAGTVSDLVNVNGAVNLGSANLEVIAGSGLQIGDSFTILTGSGGVSGQFASGTTVQAFNNPADVFTISYAGNNVVLTLSAIITTPTLDVVNGQVIYTTGAGLNSNITESSSGGNYTIQDTAGPITLTQNAINAGWTVNSGVATGPSSGITGWVLYLNDGTDTISAFDGGSANVTFNDSGTLLFPTGSTATTSGAMTLTGGSALTIAGSGTLTSGSNNITFDPTGNLTIGSTSTDNLTLNSTAVAITSAPTVTLIGTVTATSATVTVSNVTDVVAGAGQDLLASTLNLTTTNSAGSAANNLNTSAGTLTLSTGAGGVYITDAGNSGAATTVTATATGTGTVSINVLAGTLNAAGITTVSGNVILSSGDNVILNANVNAGSGTISISADTDGLAMAGTNSYDQTSYALITTNTTANAATITVNTPSAGAGDAVIGWGSIGSNGGGTITVNSNGGNILWSNDSAFLPLGTSQIGTTNGGSAPQGAHGSQIFEAALKANNYVFSATGATSAIGDAQRPIQTDSYAPADNTAGAANLTLTAGSGGIYVTDWGTSSNNDITLKQAIATGAGNIRVTAANAGGHNLFVDGPVDTGSGTITLYSDDDLIFTNNAVIGDATNFSGTVTLEANRDQGNGQFFYMAPSSSITTTNNSSTAVVILVDSAASGSDLVVPSDIPGGGAELSNITVGAGGTISVDVTHSTSTAHEGSIVQQTGTLLDTGGIGTVILTARAGDAAGSGNASAAYGQGNIGIGGTTSSPTLLPIRVSAATVTATTSGTTLGNTGSINILDTVAGSFTATTSGNAVGTITLTTTSGALTIGGATSTTGGSITLNGSGGVSIPNGNTLGSTSTGAININGALTDPSGGSGTIQLGTGGLTITQNSGSTFSGTITDNGSTTPPSVGLVFGGTGSLTLAGSGAYTYTGSTAVNGGTLLVDGTLGNTSKTTVAAGATLGGGNGTSSGTVASQVVVSGTLTAGDTTSPTGQLTVGNLSFTGSAGAVTIVLNGTTAGSGFDQITAGAASGTVNLTGATLNVSVGTGFGSPAVGTTYDILVNNTGMPITGMFTNGSTVTTSGGQLFGISYTGGTSGQDVVLTYEGGANTTSTGVVSSSYNSVYGQTLTFTATVTDTSSSATPTGTVQFFDGTTLLGSGTPGTSSGNTATWTFTTTTLSVAGSPHTISAAFTGTVGAFTNSNGTAPQTVTISPKVLTVTGITAGNKSYDGTTTATLTISGAGLSGVLAGDTVNLVTTAATGTFASANVANGITVTVAGLTLSGAQAGDYTLATPQSTTTANITTATLTITASNVSGTYGSVSYSNGSSTGFSATGLVAGQTVGSVTLTTNDTQSTSGNWKAGSFTITPSAASGGTFNPSNYAITYNTGTLTIAQKGLTLTGFAVSNKTYDGTTTATITNNGTLTGIVSGDVVSLNSSGATASFANAGPGTGITVTASGYTLSGADAANYTLTEPTTTANITAAANNTISATLGSPQTTTVATVFGSQLLVTVLNGSNQPVAGVSVTFTAPSSGTGSTGTFSNGMTTITATTNASGQVAETFTANTVAGSYTVTATTAGATSPANFSLTNQAGAPASITVSAGSSQNTAVNSSFANPLVALVTDQYSNPVAGASVTFTAPGSGASGSFSNSSATIAATTNSAGQLSETFTANTVAGSYTVSASVSGASTPASFSLTNNAGSATHLAFTVQPSNTAGGSAINPAVQVAVEDQYNNVVSGDNTDQVTLAVATGPGSFTAGSSTSATVHNGVASFNNLHLNTAGSYTLSENAGGGLAGSNSSSFNVTLAVISLTPTPTGFTATFSQPFNNSFSGNTNQLNLYDASSANDGAADVTLVSTTTGKAITGSLLIDPTNSTITFVKTTEVGTNGLPLSNSWALLPADTYRVTLVSGAHAFETPTGGLLLDGNSDGVAGDNFSTTFTINPLPSNTLVVTVPDFARGPDSSTHINVPNNSSPAVGIPIDLTLLAPTQTVTLGGTITGGNFRLSLNGSSTGAISWSSNATTLATNIRNALGALSSVGGISNVTVTSSGPFTVSFGSSVANPPLMAVSVNSLTGTGTSISVTNPNAPASITDATFVLDYNANLLTISGGTVNPALSGASFTVTTSGSGASAQATIVFHSSTGISTATLNSVLLGGLTAVVPSTAAYKSKELLHFDLSSAGNNTINGGAIPVVTSDGLHVVAFPGDTTGDGTYTSADSVNMVRVAGKADTGFGTFPLLDPVILADLSDNGLVDSGDSTILNQLFSGGSPVQIPAYPGAPSNNPAGPDPRLSIPTGLQVGPNGVVTVPVNIDDPVPAANAGMTQATLALRYDPKVLQVSPSDVHLGTVPASGSGWTLQTQVNPKTGELAITLFSVTPISSAAAGSLVTIDFHQVGKGSAGTTPINLAASVNPSGHLVVRTAVDDVQGPFTLTPVPTNAANDPGVDGSVLLQSATSRQGGSLVDPAVAEAIWLSMGSPAGNSATVLGVQGTSTPAGGPTTGQQLPGSVTALAQLAATLPASKTLGNGPGLQGTDELWATLAPADLPLATKAGSQTKTVK